MIKDFKRIKGFVVLYVGVEEWILSKGYNLYKYNIETGKKEFFSKLNDRKYSFLSKFYLSRRLFRAEITHLYYFNDNWMCIAKKGIFKYSHNTKTFEKCCNIEKGSRPMCLCQANDGTIYYGEYCSNPLRSSMRIFKSCDNGDSWSVAFTFKDDEINHIHGIFNDPYSEKIWVATGDDDKACIFGYTEDGFKTFIKEYEGSQQNRVCVPLFTKDEIIFATDSQYEQNYIRSINRQTGEITNLCKIQGSGIYATTCGNVMLVSTTVEPSKVNLDKSSHLWYSLDGHNWKELLSFEKDCWNTIYFQFGSIRFPNFADNNSDIIITGRALKYLDQSSLIIQKDKLA